MLNFSNLFKRNRQTWWEQTHLDFGRRAAADEDMVCYNVNPEYAELIKYLFVNLLRHSIIDLTIVVSNNKAYFKYYFDNGKTLKEREVSVTEPFIWEGVSMWSVRLTYLFGDIGLCVPSENQGWDNFYTFKVNEKLRKQYENNNV